MVESGSRRPAGTLTVGVLTPHVTPGPETEIPLMSSGHVATVVSRVPLAEAGDAGSARQQLVASMRPDVVDRAAAAFSTGSVDALAYASTSAGYAAGIEAEESLVGRLQDRWAVPVVSSSLATVRALRAFGLERVVLVHPPWFDEETSELGAGYFRTQGLDARAVRADTLPNEPAEVQAADVLEWVTRHLSDPGDAVFFGGNGFRTAAAVDELERRTGRLVLSANQVLLWAILTATASPLAVTAYGRLLRDRAPSRA
jgi:maleate isomerase